MNQPLIHNASAMARGATANLNCSDVDKNRYDVFVKTSVILAEKAVQMAARGELDLAKQIHAEYKQARRDAANLAARLGIQEGV